MVLPGPLLVASAASIGAYIKKSMPLKVLLEVDDFVGENNDVSLTSVTHSHWVNLMLFVFSRLVGCYRGNFDVMVTCKYHHVLTEEPVSFGLWPLLAKKET